MSFEQTTLGAGCFWGAEAFFRGMDGVIDTRVGHSTGTDGSTAPARIEVVQIDFDPAIISYHDLIEMFWTSHNPTTFDQQGDETGEGVRSAIFVHSAEQTAIAHALRDRFASAVLFADGAGAVVLAPDKHGICGLKASALSADGSGYNLITIPSGGSNQPFSATTPMDHVLMTMRDGREVFTRAVELMTKSAQDVMAETGITASAIDHFIPHQANIRLCDAVRHNLGLNEKQTISTIAHYGNSSAATIPLSLSLRHQRQAFKCGAQLLMTAAGAGLSGGAVLFTV